MRKLAIIALAAGAIASCTAASIKTKEIKQRFDGERQTYSAYGQFCSEYRGKILIDNLDSGKVEVANGILRILGGIRKGVATTEGKCREQGTLILSSGLICALRGNELNVGFVEEGTATVNKGEIEISGRQLKGTITYKIESKELFQTSKASILSCDPDLITLIWVPEHTGIYLTPSAGEMFLREYIGLSMPGHLFLKIPDVILAEKIENIEFRPDTGIVVSTKKATWIGENRAYWGRELTDENDISWKRIENKAFVTKTK